MYSFITKSDTHAKTSFSHDNDGGRVTFSWKSWAPIGWHGKLRLSHAYQDTPCDDVILGKIADWWLFAGIVLGLLLVDLNIVL